MFKKCQFMPNENRHIGKSLRSFWKRNENTIFLLFSPPQSVRLSASKINTYKNVACAPSARNVIKSFSFSFIFTFSHSSVQPRAKCAKRIRRISKDKRNRRFPQIWFLRFLHSEVRTGRKKASDSIKMPRYNITITTDDDDYKYATRYTYRDSRERERANEHHWWFAIFLHNINSICTVCCHTAHHHHHFSFSSQGVEYTIGCSLRCHVILLGHSFSFRLPFFPYTSPACNISFANVKEQPNPSKCSQNVCSWKAGEKGTDFLSFFVLLDFDSSM